ncbi:hypothetical protein NIES22_70520 (plasmid) [Calothrix brevissima NIES-22]|nr:hypothetical protein NIES22_70520 [Calothrix brevissima NIES-22]
MQPEEPRTTKQARQETVNLGTNTSIVAFLLDTGEIRYSKAGIAQLLGYATKWINGLRSDAPKLLKALQDKGYTDYAIRVAVRREGKRGATIAETISLDDLNILIAFEAERGNPKAIALLTAGFRQYLIDQSRTAFDLEERTQQEKLDDFEQWRDAFLANYDDWADIEEQETTIAFVAPDWWEVAYYSPTASGYEADPECHQSE